jgi:glycosyltransferase involved in cell wall biosynthesis
MLAYTHYQTDSRVRREAEALVERGDKVDFICLDNGNEENPELYHGVRLIKIHIDRYRGSDAKMYMASYLKFFLVALIKLAKLQLKNSYQVIQVHTMPDFMVFTAILPKLLGAKILLDVHDLMPELYQSKFGFNEAHLLIRFITWMERLSIGFANRAIAVHKPHLEALCRHGNPPQKFVVLQNLADMKIFIRETDRQTRSESGFELIYHGTVSERHGLEVAVRAVSALQGKIEGLRLSVIGDGDYISHLADLVKELGLRDVVQISKGMVPLDELACQIKSADVGIVPILYDDFTKYMLPVKLLEYVAIGKAVICSRTETIESYFDDSMVQFFSPGSVTELAESILLLYRNPARRRDLIANSDKFNVIYSWEQQKLAYYALIDGLLEK